MNKKMGDIISMMRKQNGMTQLELAEKMGVTDKAVSKWERNLSMPDIASIPLLSEVLGVSIEELMQIKHQKKRNNIKETLNIILKAIGIAMGVAAAVLTLLNKADVNGTLIMLGIGMSCIGISALDNKTV